MTQAQLRWLKQLEKEPDADVRNVNGHTLSSCRVCGWVAQVDGKWCLTEMGRLVLNFTRR